MATRNRSSDRAAFEVDAFEYVADKIRQRIGKSETVAIIHGAHRVTYASRQRHHLQVGCAQSAAAERAAALQRLPNRDLPVDMIVERDGKR